MNEQATNFCSATGHQLEVIDESYDHEFGCEQIFFYRCSVCGSTSEEDTQIPDYVEGDEE